ncbi:hypothetical protein HYALB_00005642 [Hymenoscyphus albidus]|uniref:Prenylcysteine lyase domain-containing protein n=1 Tax=Hymenoscyphus albidus TaxID=595503 RepID=A0A9N9LI20_9HELO|nr:hypothetical protein HYALB_00005642 [Hymenoscyphus albidus]
MSPNPYPPSYKSNKEDPPPPYSPAASARITEQTPLFPDNNSNTRNPRPPIIRIYLPTPGAGSAGISTSYTLSQLPLPITKRKKIHLNITLLDKNPTIGGRLTLPFQSDNSILQKELHIEDLSTACLSQSSILAARAKSELSLNYGISRSSQTSLTKTGFYDGNGIIAEVSRPRDKVGWGWLKLVWRYGASVWRAGVLPDGASSSFVEMMRKSSFPSRSESATYESVWEILEKGGMTDAVGLGAVERLEKNGVGGKYVEEILRPQVRRQGGTEIEEVSDLVLSVLLKRENEGTCFDGEGGRVSEVLKKFVEKSGVELRLDTEVTGIRQEILDEGKKIWVLETKSTLNDTAESEYTGYDHLVIAAPLNDSLFKSPNQDTNTRETIIYRPIHTTFILTNTTPSFSPLLALLPTTPTQIHELTRLRQIHIPTTQSLIQTLFLSRILSNSIIPDEQIHTLFNGPSNVKEILHWKIENAWPVSRPRSSGDSLGGFKLGDGLWSTGMGEGVVGGVDWSWVVGENVGRLLGREFRG